MSVTYVVASLFVLNLCLFAMSASQASNLMTYPGPPGEPKSSDYSVKIDGKSLFVYVAQALRGGPASFAYFDFSGKVNVEITPVNPLTSVTIRPLSLGIKATLKSGAIRFDLSHPCNLTIELNGSIDHPLHLFANPLQTDIPNPDDPNVIYYGPGVHELGILRMHSGQTLYLSGGAVVKAILMPDEKPTVEKDWSGVKNYRNLIEAENAKNVSIKGRGVLDMSGLPWHARNAFVFRNCDHVTMEGIIIVDAPCWVAGMFGSRDITIRNIKEICRRENSDGVDICNSQNVLVENSFLRNNDDEICVKTTSPPPAQESKNIVVRNCVVWNERARGLGITSETRANITNVLFEDCDIIHDFSQGGDCASLAILVSDSGTISNIRFENIRIEDVSNTLFDGWIGEDFWGHDKTRGHVNGVLLKNITANGAVVPAMKISGFDDTHLFQNVTLDNVKVNGRRNTNMKDGLMKCNPFAREITVK